MAEIRHRTPPPRYTCGGCQNTWRPLGAAHCAACHETFSGVTNFDRHRVGGRCVPPAELKNKGKPLLRRDSAGLWRSTEEFTKWQSLL